MLVEEKDKLKREEYDRRERDELLWSGFLSLLV
jgi:hypothetical protein